MSVREQSELLRAELLRAELLRAELLRSELRGAELLRGLLNVREAASICSVTFETLRNWDMAGKLIAQRHPPTGYRYYCREDVETIIATP